MNNQIKQYARAHIVKDWLECEISRLGEQIVDMPGTAHDCKKRIRGLRHAMIAVNHQISEHALERGT